jgi:transcriptional regulator with XRE-family HTH domain
MSMMRSDRVTPLSEWLDRNEDKISRAELADRLDLLRGQVDRYARGDRKPSLDLAFDLEEITRTVTGGTDVLEARRWWNWIPPYRQFETPSSAPGKQGSEAVDPTNHI